MKRLLLNLFTMLLLPPAVTAQAVAAQAIPPKPAAPANLQLTELQKARLDAARQEVFRWQDKMQDALAKFGAICNDAQKENKWPAVQCSVNDLTVSPQAPAVTVSTGAIGASTPPEKK